MRGGRMKVRWERLKVIRHRWVTSEVRGRVIRGVVFPVDLDGLKPWPAGCGWFALVQEVCLQSFSSIECEQ